MSKGNTFENDLMQLIFNKVLPAHLGTLDDDGNDNVYISLHTGDPTEGGGQTSSECDYTNYGRVAVLRTVAGWTVADNSAENTADIVFNQCGVGDADVVTHVAIGTVDLPGAGEILYSGQLNDSLTVSNLIQPQFNAGSLVVTED